MSGLAITALVVFLLLVLWSLHELRRLRRSMQRDHAKGNQ